VPTFRANPLTPACDTWCDFPVADRPNAVRQWIAAAEKDPSMIQVSLAFNSRLAHQIVISCYVYLPLQCSAAG